MIAANWPRLLGMISFHLFAIVSCGKWNGAVPTQSRLWYLTSSWMQLLNFVVYLVNRSQCFFINYLWKIVEKSIENINWELFIWDVVFSRERSRETWFWKHLTNFRNGASRKRYFKENSFHFSFSTYFVVWNHFPPTHLLFRCYKSKFIDRRYVCGIIKWIIARGADERMKKFDRL